MSQGLRRRSAGVWHVRSTKQAHHCKCQALPITTPNIRLLLHQRSAHAGDAVKAGVPVRHIPCHLDISRCQPAIGARQSKHRQQCTWVSNCTSGRNRSTLSNASPLPCQMRWKPSHRTVTTASAQLADEVGWSPDTCRPIQHTVCELFVTLKSTKSCI